MMKKAVSRFLFLVLFVLISVLAVAGTLYVLQNRDVDTDVRESLQGVPLMPAEESSEVDYSQIDSVSLSSPDADNEIISTCGYDALTDENEKYLYEMLRESVYKISDDVDEKGRYKTKRIEITGSEMDSQSINTAINAFLYDNPQIFWIDNYFGYNVRSQVTYVECYSVLSGNQCEIYLKRFSDRVQEILSEISEDDGKYEREKKIHDKLLEICKYKKIESFDDGWQYFSAYGALVDGEAVCEGYSKAMMLLLNLSGVNATTVRGFGEGERHMWNLVEIGGNWYHLDATWDDGEEDYNHEFFNLTTDGVLIDHKIDPILSDETYTDDYSYNFFLPECKASDMNYYFVEGIVMNGTDNDSLNELSSLLYNKALSGDDIIPIQVGEEMDFEDFMYTMFENEENRKFYDCIRTANEYLDDTHKINDKSSFLLKNEKRKTARIRIVFS